MELIDVSPNNTVFLKLLKRELKEFVIPKMKYNDKILILTDPNNDNRYVSMVFFTLYLDKCSINYIHTSSKYRRQGHSLFLIQKALAVAKVHGCNYCNVAILPDCGSDIVFSKLGFKYVSETSMIFNLSL